MKKLFPLMIIMLLLPGCVRPDPEAAVATVPDTSGTITAVNPSSTRSGVFPTVDIQNTPTPLPTYDGVPTPDPPHPVADGSSDVLIHTVGAGETLGYIAQFYGRSVTDLIQANDLGEADLLFVGQQLQVPVATAVFGPAFKLIPDSELVYGPAAASFDIRTFATNFNGFLLGYEEVVEGQTLRGPDIVLLVAHRYSVNPRLLMAMLEYRSGWLTRQIGVETPFPMGHANEQLTGLYRQLGWAANELNWGFYGRSEANILTFPIGENGRVAYDATINHGTAGVQRWLGAHNGATLETWRQEAGPDGFVKTYEQLFGSPFAYTVDPLLPTPLTQPPLNLPWADDETWFFTGGPHGGWAGGSSWAALDFAPPGAQLGCVQSEAWVLAAADGIVTRSDFGAVVVDLDGDGYAGTGWAIVYMHIETRDRVPVGTAVSVGDRIGHPSCEGGFSSGTHLHIARTYNGRWIAADGDIPFEMSGWVSQGLASEYDGLLVRGTVTKEACVCRDPINAISAIE